MGCTAIVLLAGVWCSPVFSGNFSWTMDCLLLVPSGCIVLSGYTNLSFLPLRFFWFSISRMSASESWFTDCVFFGSFVPRFCLITNRLRHRAPSWIYSSSTNAFGRKRNKKCSIGESTVNMSWYTMFNLLPQVLSPARPPLSRRPRT